MNISIYVLYTFLRTRVDYDPDQFVEICAAMSAGLKSVGRNLLYIKAMFAVMESCGFIVAVADYLRKNGISELDYSDYSRKHIIRNFKTRFPCFVAVLEDDKTLYKEFVADINSQL